MSRLPFLATLIARSASLLGVRTVLPPPRLWGLGQSWGRTMNPVMGRASLSPVAVVAAALGLLALLVATLILAWPAQAQDPVLIKNTDRTVDEFNAALSGAGAKRAQGFTTGANTGGYTLSSIGVRFHMVTNEAQAGNDLTVKLFGETNGNPGTQVCVLSKPQSIASDGVNSFGAADCGVLSKSTSYYVVVERTGAAAESIGLRITETGDEDAGGETGWSIHDERHWHNSDGWGSTAGEAYLIEVRGAEVEVANTPATGAPTISGTVQVGETLTADTSGISDEDGLDNVSYGYQWIRSDSGTDREIGGATNSTYTLAEADQGKAIKVKVSFTDDADNDESLTSAATAAVAAKPNSPATGAPAIIGKAQVGETLTADTSGISDGDGLDDVSYGYQWLADDVDITGATASTYTLTTDEQGKAIKVSVSFTDDADNDESLSSAATAAVAAKDPALIENTGQALESFHAALNDQGKRAQGFTTGSNDGGYRMISVGVRFHQVANPAQAGQDLTVRLLGETGGNPGEEVCVLSKPERIVSDVVNSFGAPAGCGVLSKSTSYFVVVERSGAEAGLIGLRITETGDEDAGGETGWSILDERHWFHENAWGKKTGEAHLIEVRGAEVPVTNTPATGAPTISGTAQVGQTLTADTSGFSDADGLDDVSYGYQWLADDADIDGATTSTYTLVDGDVGKTIKVEVSFTDDAGYEESLTSAATAAVAPEILQFASAVILQGDLAPSNLTAQVAANGASLSWDAPALDAGSITGYEIMRAVGDGELATLVSDTGSADTTYTDTTATAAGTTYAYTVKARRGTEQSPASNRVEVLMPGSGPTNLLARRVHGEDGITPAGYSLSWAAPAEDAGSVTGYRILRGQDGTELSVLVSDTGNTTRTYTDATATGSGTSYQYRVLALRGAEVSRPSPLALVLDAVLRSTQPAGGDSALQQQVPQSAETSVWWQATMTVGVEPFAARGYSVAGGLEDYVIGMLTDTTFDVGGVTYTVQDLFHEFHTNADVMHLRLSAEIPRDFVLMVDGVTFHSSEADFLTVAGAQYRWPRSVHNFVFSQASDQVSGREVWPLNTQVPVSIQPLPPVRITGTPVAGGKLTADLSKAIDDDGFRLPNLHFACTPRPAMRWPGIRCTEDEWERWVQWQRDDGDGQGWRDVFGYRGRQETYVVPQENPPARLRVELRYWDGAGNFEQHYSLPVDVFVKKNTVVWFSTMEVATSGNDEGYSGRATTFGSLYSTDFSVGDTDYQVLQIYHREQDSPAVDELRLVLSARYSGDFCLRLWASKFCSADATTSPVTGGIQYVWTNPTLYFDNRSTFRASIEAEVDLFVADSVPSAPTGLSVISVSTSSVELQWTAPTDDGGLPIIGYQILEYGSPDWRGYAIVADIPPTATSWTLDGLEPGTVRRYQLQARNLKGLGAPSNMRQGVTGRDESCDIWCADAVTKSTSQGIGYSTSGLYSGSSISDNDFTLGGTTYTVTGVTNVTADAELNLALNSLPAASAVDGLSLYVNGIELPFVQATRTSQGNAHYFTWADPSGDDETHFGTNNTNFTDGGTVNLRIGSQFVNVVTITAKVASVDFGKVPKLFTLTRSGSLANGQRVKIKYTEEDSSGCFSFYPEQSQRDAGHFAIDRDDSNNKRTSITFEVEAYSPGDACSETRYQSPYYVGSASSATVTVNTE